jgi:predicted permease
VPFDVYQETGAVVSTDQAGVRSPDESDEALQAGVNRVDPGYLRTMGVALLRGREFTMQDRDSAPRVAIVNETFAEGLWPGQEALGKQFHWQSRGDPIEVIGVVQSGKYLFLGEAPRPFVYLPIAQAYRTTVTLHLRTAADDPLALAPAVQRMFRDLDPALPVFNIRSMEEHLRSSVFAFLPLRMGAFLAGAQGLIGLLLAVMGVYGVVSYSMSQQERDIGIQIALGASKLDVFHVASRSGLWPTVAGLMLGLAASVGVARLLAVLVYGLNPVNIPVFTAVVMLVLGVSLLACWLPARRAARVDPVTALRQE